MNLLVSRFQAVFVPTAIALTMTPCAGSGDTAFPQLLVNEGRMSIQVGSGIKLSGPELTHASFELANSSGAEHRVRIKSVQPAPEGLAVPWLFELEVYDEHMKAWRDFCRSDKHGGRLAFPYRGNIDATGRFDASADTVSLACSSGAVSKCVSLGYVPWSEVGDVSLLNHFQACLRMIRADYCGDGVGHTQDGVQIDVYDNTGIQQMEGGPDFSFEASWGPDGAICVEKTRLTQSYNLPDLIADCGDNGRLRIGHNCSEPVGPDLVEPLIFNRSRP